MTKKDQLKKIKEEMKSLRDQRRLLLHRYRYWKMQEYKLKDKIKVEFN